jgi:hypothetical protein
MLVLTPTEEFSFVRDVMHSLLCGRPRTRIRSVQFANGVVLVGHVWSIHVVED